MVSFNKFFTSVYLAVVYASVASAAPWTAESSIGTHRVHKIGKRELVAFNPPSKFEVFEAGLEHPNTNSLQEVTLEESTVAFIHERLDVDAANIAFKRGYTEDETTYAYVQQKHKGINFANSVANVAFKDDKVVAFGNSFVETAKIADSIPTVSIADAVATAEEALNGKKNEIAAKLEYVVLEDGAAILAHVFQIRNEDEDIFLEAFVDAHTGELRSVVDFVAQASYRALPITKTYPTQGFETIVDPQIAAASPQGWHNTGTTASTVGTTTAGNNAVSYKGATSAVTTQSSTGLVFNYVASLTTAPTTAVNVDAARVNTFYVTNMLHDIWYLYGFTETSYNFQTNNFGKGGSGNDRVQVSVQDAGGFNNANFATPPDGQTGQMRMYLWNGFTPNRDGDFENDIVIHEYTHGLTNRVTGGGTGRCLSTTESGGLGEGWGDAMADWASTTSATVADFTLGSWAAGRNIRRYPYSGSATTNPLRYSSLASSSGVHQFGEIWANALHNVHIALLAAHGYSADAKTNPNATGGNAVWLHLFIDALKLQPCNPSFVDARAAWIQADANRYAGANKCILWKAFASRGLGSAAISRTYRDDTTVPTGC
ncbi:Fungalysin metallopeptidase-domain-containing protein [Pterulicium gracile]|uniref:Extracellular metalloproteinase n=1 Tax=Pterulicium gracile TaxID=1884261 RepID=A0A5C3Q3T3_9AGAR|nr:Fungalysin metallopeptidase-domain-containing protein [Pterula gracilis]